MLKAQDERQGLGQPRCTTVFCQTYSGSRLPSGDVAFRLALAPRSGGTRADRVPLQP
jgi:hypothetical protein